jgi:cellobiose phosphorylase
MIYKFVDDKGVFLVKNPQKVFSLYFPLTNKEGGLLSSIAPNLGGDIKKDNDRFLTPPASIEDIKNNPLCRREFFIKVRPESNILRLSEAWRDTLEAGILYHKLIKENDTLKVEILNFIPFDLDVEVMWVKVENKKNRPIQVIPTSFIPLYGRGEKNLRDHRHVTSLLNRITLLPLGIILKPTMVFDERGHRENETHYFVLGYQDKRIPPLGQFPTLQVFCGESGNLSYPEAIYRNLKPFRKKIKSFDGKEVCASFRFKTTTLKRGETTDFVLMMGISEDRNYINYTFSKLDSLQKVEDYLERTKRFWRDVVLSLKFDFKDKNFNNWLLWIGLQPILRKLFGCSFLPHFDYGKGGRGFRDLWQDILTLTLRDDPDLDKMIINNFKGVRIDGSHATIITSDGNFISDRNKITRVWTDHGIWPLLTTKLYVERKAEFGLLFRKAPYFKDHQLKRAREIDHLPPAKDNFLRTKDGKVYLGSILEHLLVENLVQFFNVGQHNILRLENGDWNDGLDMASLRGECVPFYCMYAYNLKTLAEILELIKDKNKFVEVLQELTLLLSNKKPINYNSDKVKRKILEEYLEKTKHNVSGKRVKINIESLINDLLDKANWIYRYIRRREWLKVGFFNGYYDNKGKRVEGKTKGKIRLFLQSQVFPIMSGIATDHQIRRIWKSVNLYLKDKRLNGFRLNTDFEDIYLDLGRAFGFSYGDKENGAIFCHMVVLFAYALYKRNFIKEGSFVLNSIYTMSSSPLAKIYPMIPEYFNSEGRGLYLYLTGSASWYIYTLFEQVLGIKFREGKVIIQPKLTDDFFFQDSIEVAFRFLRRDIKIIFRRTKKSKILSLKRAFLFDTPLNIENNSIKIERGIITPIPLHKECIVKVDLA